MLRLKTIVGILGQPSVKFFRMRHQEFGQPVTNYSKLNFDALTYTKINEFFLVGFIDLKKMEKNDQMKAVLQKGAFQIPKFGY